jgi:hypothetical protein
MLVPCRQMRTTARAVECGCDGSVSHIPPMCSLCQALEYLKNKTICPASLKRVVCAQFTAAFSSAEGFAPMAPSSSSRLWDEAECVEFFESNLFLLYVEEEENQRRQAELALLMAQ